MSRLTKTAVDGLRYQEEGGRRQVLWDSEISGFGVRVYPSGRKSFVLSYRFQGRKQLLTLGQHSQDFTLAEARDEALDARRTLGAAVR